MTTKKATSVITGKPMTIIFDLTDTTRTQEMPTIDASVCAVDPYISDHEAHVLAQEDLTPDVPVTIPWWLPIYATL